MRKITAEQRQEIIKKYSIGKTTQKKPAEEYKISSVLVWKILEGTQKKLKCTICGIKVSAHQRSKKDHILRCLSCKQAYLASIKTKICADCGMMKNGY